MPPYWVRVKAGMMPGYMSVVALFPEVKTGTRSGRPVDCSS
jgi:hypothetical protein